MRGSGLSTAGFETRGISNFERFYAFHRCAHLQCTAALQSNRVSHQRARQVVRAVINAMSSSVDAIWNQLQKQRPSKISTADFRNVPGIRRTVRDIRDGPDVRDPSTSTSPLEPAVSSRRDRISMSAQAGNAVRSWTAACVDVECLCETAGNPFVPSLPSSLADDTGRLQNQRLALCHDYSENRDCRATCKETSTASRIQIEGLGQAR